jgi:hypothetical protein
MFDFSGFQTRNVLFPPPVAIKFPNGDHAKLRTMFEEGTEPRGGGVSGYDTVFCRTINCENDDFLGAWNLRGADTVIVAIEDVRSLW